MSDNTYGFANLQIRRIRNKFGKHILTDSLFINLQDYWTEFRNLQKRYLFWHSHMWKLEMNIRRKWSKDLPKVNNIFKKHKEEGEEFFDPTHFSIEFDCEKYFKLLNDWKLKNEKKCLEENPYLNFSPCGHKKILGKPRPTIRGFYKNNFIFF